MIARTWHARTTEQNTDAYRKHYVEQNLPKLQAIAGFIGAQLCFRSMRDGVEIFVVTYWESLAAIDAFAKPDREAAVVPQGMAPLLVSYDDRVLHFEVVVDTFNATKADTTCGSGITGRPK